MTEQEEFTIRLEIENAITGQATEADFNRLMAEIEQNAQVAELYREALVEHHLFENYSTEASLQQEFDLSERQELEELNRGQQRERDRGNGFSL